MKKHAILLPVLAGCLGFAPCLFGENLIRNGSFEQLDAKTHLPQHWKCASIHQAPVRFTVVQGGVEGENALDIQNDMTKKVPNVFGSLSQKITLKPDEPYLFTFYAKGDPKTTLVLIAGKSWTKRFYFNSFSPEWQSFAAVVKLPASELDAKGQADFRLNTDQFADFQLDNVRLIPEKEVILKNGSFEGAKGKLPWGWTFRVMGGAKCTAALNPAGKLKLTNASPKRANVFGGLSQRITLKPGQKYVIRIRYQSDSGQNQLALGVKWQLRKRLPASPVWRTESFFVTAPQETLPNGTIPFNFLCDGVTRETLIDFITIEPVATQVFSPTTWQDGNLYDVPRFHGSFAALTAIPKELPVLTFPRSAKSYSGRAPQLPPPTDLSARTALAFDDFGLIVMTDVCDDFCSPGEGRQMWRGDSVQIRLDCGALALDQAAPTDLELSFAIDKTGKLSSWCTKAGPHYEKYEQNPLPPELCRLTGVRRKGSYFIAAHLAWDLVRPVDLQKQPFFGFTVAVNDRDAESQREVIFLSRGLHDAKSSRAFVDAFLDNGRPVVRLKAQKEESALLKGELLMAHQSGNFEVTAEVTGDGLTPIRTQIGQVTTKKKLVKLPYSLPLPPGFEGKYQLTFRLNGQVAAQISGEKVFPVKMAAKNLEELTAGLNDVQTEIAGLKKQGRASEYLDVPLRILSYHLPVIQRRFEAAKSSEERRYYADQILMITPECRDLLAEMNRNITKLKRGQQLPETWHYRSSAISWKAGWPQAMVQSSTGKRELRPIVCIGYGHFSTIDQHLPLYPGMSVNTVQAEIGPSKLFPREGKNQEFEPDFTYFHQRFDPLLKRAWENHVQIVLLISPHYCPAWLLKKYPDLKAFAKPKRAIGFIKYEQTHPKAVEMLDRYLKELIPLLKNHPYAKAIHSICLTNEPEALYCIPENPVTVKNFSAWMCSKYGTVAEFNRIAGTNYPTFTAVAAAESQDQAASYAFQSYVQDFYVGWHREFAAGVRRFWPDIPIHSKIMVFISPYTLFAGVDPERWSEFSDLNGNDNYSSLMNGNDCYSSHEGTMNAFLLGHEIQISSKKVTVANTESHIIRDGETKPVSNDFIYASVFEQLITGAATVTTWVYQDIDWAYLKRFPKEKAALGGNIFLRPGNQAAHAKATLDGMRLAPELQKFFQYDPEIAFFYPSTSAMLHGDTGCLAGLSQLATQLASTGYRARALTERQTAAGKFGKVKLLFIAGAPSVTREGAAGLKKFAQQGGRIVLFPDSLKKDAYGRPLKIDFPVTAVNGVSLTEIETQIKKTPGIPPLPVKVSAGKDGLDAVVYRTVPDGAGGWLVHLYNGSLTEKELHLSGNGTWFDLIRQMPGRLEYELKPNQLLLLRFTPDGRL